MSEHKQWQRPVFIDPQQLGPDQKAPAAKAPNADTVGSKPRELPLDQVQLLDEEPVAAPPRVPKPRRGARLLAWSLGGLLTAGVSAELYRLLSWGLDTHVLLGLGFAVLILLVLGGSAWQLWRSLKGLRQLRRIEAIQHQAQALMAARSQGQAQAVIAELERHFQQHPARSAWAEARQQLDSAYNDGEVIRFLSRQVLQAQDQQARRLVQRYSVESGVLVAVSPWASFDMLLVGWRNLRMLREVAQVYGIAPGAAAQWNLLRRVLHNLAFAGLSEMAIDTGSQVLGSSLTASLSARAGQGLGAGLFTARIGQQAIGLCRPLPLERDERLLKSVAGALLERLAGNKKP